MNGYKTSEDSMYSKIRSSLFYGIMHDGITKFGKEYNGTCLRGVDCETYEPFNVPYCLTNVPSRVSQLGLTSGGGEGGIWTKWPKTA